MGGEEERDEEEEDEAELRENLNDRKMCHNVGHKRDFSSGVE